MPEQLVNIAFITDENYAEPTMIAIQSAIENKNTDTKYIIHVLAYNLCEKTRKTMEHFSSVNNITLKIIEINNLEKYRNIKQSRYITPTACLKFDLPLIISDTEKILYLDSDIIVQDDLYYLYNTDIENYYAAVIEDAVTLTPANYHKSSICLNDRYFNSGVLLLNLKRMKKDNSPQKLLTWREHNQGFYMDQDALNEILGQQVIYLSCWYNFITFYPEKHSAHLLSKLYGTKVPNNKIEAYEQAVILHYAGPNKPWKAKIKYLTTEYNKYLKHLEENKVPHRKQIINRNSTITTNYIPPIFPNGIPVIYASDNNYVPYLAVSIKSLIDNASPHNYYDIIILETSISNKNKQKLQKMSRKNISIRFFEMGSFIKNCKFFTNRYLSIETYYRLFIANICQLYKKAIYLDCDTLILCDIANLYNIDLKDNIIAATNDLPSYYHRITNDEIYGVKRRDYTQNKLRINDTREYFNAGVLVFNISQMIRNNTTNLFLNKIKEIENPICHDQDILNAACYKKVLFLEQKWNFYNFFNQESLKKKNIKIRFDNLPNYLKKEYIEAYKNPLIIHYAGNEKVWYNPNIEFGLQWWNCAKKTPFYKQIVKKKNIYLGVYGRITINLFGIKVKINIKNILKNIFSITNKENRKIISILGLKIKIKSKKLVIKQKLHDVQFQYKNLSLQIKPHKDLYYFKKKSINKEKVLSLIENFRNYGINKEHRNQQVIISLTSYPDRMYDIHYTIFSLLNQNFKPDKIILWLSAEEFPNRDNDVPQKIRNLTQFGLEIQYCENLRSFKKLIPTLEKYPNDIIVTADDDIYYSNDWLEKLMKKYTSSNKKTIIAHRCHKIKLDNRNNIAPYKNWEKCVINNENSFFNFFTGAGGVLYPPKVLYKDINNNILFQKLTPTGDDIWFWAMSVLNDTKIAIVDEPFELIYINPERELNFNDDKTLYLINGTGGANDEQIANILEAYPEIKRKLNAELYNIQLY